MRIALLETPEGDVVARDEEFGGRKGRFILLPTGSVVYRHPDDRRDWLAGRSRKEFWEAAEAWNRYQDEVIGLPEPDQLTAVERLRAALDGLGVLTDAPDALWPVLLEQAQAGLL